MDLQERAYNLLNWIGENINLWGQFHKEHNQNGRRLSKEIDEAYFLFYSSIKELADKYDEIIAYLDGVNVEFEIARETESFEVEILIELKQTMIGMLEFQENKRECSQSTAERLTIGHKEIENEILKITSDSKQVSENVVNYGTGIGASLGAIIGDLSIAQRGVIAAYLVSGLNNYYGKTGLEKLSKTTQSLIKHMADLQKDFIYFQCEINKMPLEINNYIASVSKCIKYSTPNDPQSMAYRIRVKKMSENMIWSTKALNEKFIQIRDMARFQTEEIEQESQLLIEKAHEEHVKYYRLMKNVSGDCENYIAFLDNVFQEFIIAKEKKFFDASFTNELKESIFNILTEMQAKDIARENLSKEFIDCIGEISDLDRKIDHQIKNHASNNTMLIEGAGSSGAILGMTIAGIVATGATMGIFGAIMLGALCGGLILGGAAAAITHHQKNDLIKLQNVVEKLKDKMDTGYIKLVEKCIRYSCENEEENTVDEIRVEIMAENMMEKTEELKDGFKKVRDLAREKQSEVRELIYRHNPHDLLIADQ
ncbi:uncharacterized protein EV154DRAFT_560794 [Mucor mucedo]|uniref:uncharacterized protein n=1 Tax=Mucor mucedo TaxID=29922 RepID=UPI002220B6E5|nr:uncharacterized protein EV154DRAFT_560794 [Mucor mucedo]KAI7894026.1 hypothetical protein EV154DRAFT_560794 [Mucor mucedo]